MRGRWRAGGVLVARTVAYRGGHQQAARPVAVPRPVGGVL